MAKYRCPVCGATHKSPPEKCRLCGQMMGSDAVVGDFAGSKHQIAEKKGIGGVAALATLGVVVFVLALVLVGLVPGRQQMGAFLNKIPLIPKNDKTGWVRFQDDEGGFSAEMPTESPQRESETDDVIHKDFQAWTMWMATDSELSVAYVKDFVGDPATVNERKSIEALADAESEAWKTQGVKIDKLTDTTFWGHPAWLIESRDWKEEKSGSKLLTGRTLYFLNGKTLYRIQTKSQYREPDLYNKLAGGFELLKPVPAAGPTGSSIINLK